MDDEVKLKVDEAVGSYISRNAGNDIDVIPCQCGAISLSNMKNN